MDFIARINALKPKHYQPLWTRLSQLGNFREIVSYINAMEVISPEDNRSYHYIGELRLDDRFAVYCLNEAIEVVPTNRVQYWYLCQEENIMDGGCRGGWMTDKGLVTFCVRKQDSKAIFDRLCKFCPEFSGANLVKSEPGPTQLSYDGRFLIFIKTHLFSRGEIEYVPLANVLACSLVYTDDGEYDFCYLKIYLRDGSVRYMQQQGAHECFQMARTLKYYAPHIRYRLDSLK